MHEQQLENNSESYADLAARRERISAHLRTLVASGHALLGAWDALQYDEPGTRKTKARELISKFDAFFELYPPMDNPMSSSYYANDAYALLAEMPKSAERDAFKQLLFETIDFFDALESAYSACQMLLHAPED